MLRSYVGLLLALLIAAGCGDREPPDGSNAYCAGEAPIAGERECRMDADCGAGTRCEPSPNTEVQSVRAPIVAPPVCTPQMPCTADEQCGEGSVCDVAVDLNGLQPFPMPCPASGTVCIPACSCSSDERCRDDGHCEITPCDSVGAPPCPAGSACMPGVGDPGVELSRTAQAGCVRVRCDQPGGVTCEADWTCDPARAPMGFDVPPWGNTAGCAPIPCDAGFTCESSLVCYPDGASTAIDANFNLFATRADGRWVDPHGCVQPSCEEGWDCSAIGPTECVVGDERASQFGCRNQMCDEPGGADCEALSSGTQWCQPDAPWHNASLGSWGCAIKDCLSGFACGADEVCEPTHIARGQGGCVPMRCIADASLCVGRSGGVGGAGAGGAGLGGAGLGGAGASGSAGSAGIAGNAGSAGSAGGGMRGTAPLGALCASDTDCACGSCVLQHCARRPGICVVQ
jgi:hypothetical protein